MTTKWPWGFAAAVAVALAAGTAAANQAVEATAALALLATALLVTAVALGLDAQRRARGEAEAAGERATALDALLASAPDAYYLWDRRTGGERRSPGLDELLGLAAGAKGFGAVVDRFAAGDAARLSKAVDGLAAGGDRFTLLLADAAGARSLLTNGCRLGTGNDGPGAIVVWFRNVSELVASRDEARAECARLGGLLDALPIPVWQRQADLSLAYCNKAYADIVEADAETAVSGDGIELVAEADRAQARALADQAQADKVSRAQAHHVVVDGERRLLSVNETPFADDGTVGVAWDITSLEEVKRDFDHHLAAHADVLEQLATAIAIFGPDKQLKFFNSAYARLWKLDEDWLGGEPLFGEVLEMLRAQHRIPDVPDFPAFKKKREAVFTGLLEPQEELLHLPDGRTLRMVVTPHPLGGVLVTFEDVTDVLALERSLNTLIAVQRATLDNLYEGVAVFGSDGRLKLSNPGYARLWNLAPKRLESEPHISEVLEWTKDLYDHGDDWETYKTRIIARTTERTAAFDRLERRDMSILNWTNVPLPDGATLITYVDVTDSVNVERALRERAAALEEADRLKSEFIAHVSYELRTPLNTIIGFGELLSRKFYGDLNARQIEYVTGILDSSNDLLQLINDILDLASAEAGYMELDMRDFDLDAALAGMLMLASERMRSGNLVFEYRCPGALGTMVGDERRIKQMVFHLVTNAIKFTPAGGQAILEARRAGDIIAISISDTGIGIPPDEQPHVFEKFWRSEEAQGRHHGGGLGLSLVKSFVELHGGHVELESAPGEGTRITCHLPVDAHAARGGDARGD